MHSVPIAILCSVEPVTDAEPSAPSPRRTLVLVAALVAAMVWANGSASTYRTVLRAAVSIPLVPHHMVHSVATAVTNAAMVVFFLAVGAEIGHERAHGSLADRRAATLPVLAALGGMVGAAATYLLVAASAGAPRSILGGWGIPMATDIAFALAALQLGGTSVPRSLRTFVLALAVADDIAAVVVLGLVTSASVNLTAGIGALVVVGGVLAMRRWVNEVWPYLLATVALYLSLARAGIEPILAGVVVGALLPTRSSPSGASVNERCFGPLDTASAFVILPLFVLANTGVAFSTSALGAPHAGNVGVSIVVARTIGKTIGIVGAVAIASAVGVGQLHPSIHRRHLVGAAILCGVGFTVPLLFADVHFASSPHLLAAVQLGLLGGSAVCLLVGIVVLRGARRAQVG